MSASINTYLSLITSEHRNRPNFVALITAICQFTVDTQNTLNTLPILFNVNLAVGDQLDKIGAWVGVSRNLNQTILGVTTLDDATYRVLIILTIAQNSWDGTVPGMYRIWNALLASTYGGILIQDNQDMTMTIILLNPPSSVLILAILTQGYFLMVPAGVGINFLTPSQGGPIFGWGIENTVIAGWGEGSWLVTA